MKPTRYVETPRTDAAIQEITSPEWRGSVVRACFARQLEIETLAPVKHLPLLEKRIKKTMNIIENIIDDSSNRQIWEVSAQLREAHRLLGDIS